MLENRESPFFIVGAGRSGTTLVRSLLHGHSNLCVTPETHFIKRAFRNGANTHDAPSDFDRFWRDLIVWSRFLDLGVSPESVRQRIDAAGDRTFRTIFVAMLDAFAAHHGKPRVGEKTPGHYRYLDKISAWFPDAKVVVLRRDPRDVVASHLKSPWVRDELSPGRLSAPLLRRLRLFHVTERALFWRHAYGRYLNDVSAHKQMRLVVYEDLVRDPAGEVAKLCAFLGEPFEPQMLQERDGGTADTGFEGAWKSWSTAHTRAADAPVRTDSIGRWQSSLSDREAAVIEAICGPLMRRFGYQTETRSTATRALAYTILAAGRTEDILRRRPLPRT